MVQAAVARLTTPIKRGVKTTIETKRLGNLPADHSLDLLNFFIADVQTGFGPFIAVYLTAHTWSLQQIGVALSAGSLIAILAQVPSGAFIDAIHHKRLVGAIALASIGLSAMLLALFPTRLPVLGAEALHGLASCLLVPSIAAITLSRVGRANLGERLGRNTRFSALGSTIGASIMGALGTYWLAQSVFWCAAAFTIPGMIAIAMLPPRHKTEPRPEPLGVKLGAKKAAAESWRVLLDRRLIIFACCVALFFLSNAAMLPLAAAGLTGPQGMRANLVVAACVVVPQLMVAALAPLMGRLAERWGRRPVLLIGFAALPLRGLLLSVLVTPTGVIAAQALDGVGGSVFGVMLPLVAADVTRGTNRFNLCLGLFGLAAGLGATVSTTLGGVLATQLGNRMAFLCLGAAGAAAMALVAFALPETKAKLPAS